MTALRPGDAFHLDRGGTMIAGRYIEVDRRTAWSWNEAVKDNATPTPALLRLFGVDSEGRCRRRGHWNVKRTLRSTDSNAVNHRRSYARRRLRKAFRAFVREYWQVVLVFSSAIAAVSTVCLVIQPSRFMSGLTVGIVVTALSAAFLLFFLMTDGNVLTLAGAWAEDFSNDELRKAVKARSAWGAVANIELGSFDIDHLVVAPGGVFAIETKARLGKLDHGRLLDDVAQARTAAKKAESILRSQQVLMPREVQPVLVIWGKRAMRDLPTAGRLVDDVPVVPVAHLAEWLITYQIGLLAQDHAEEMLSRLREFKNGQVLREPVLA